MGAPSLSSQSLQRRVALNIQRLRVFTRSLLIGAGILGSLGRFPQAAAQNSPPPQLAPAPTAAPAAPRRKHPSYEELTKKPDPLEKTWDRYKLTDSAGKEFSVDKFRGKLVLVNFFFAHCPDICPPQTAGLNTVLKKLGPREREAIVFVSISIDPERDTSKQLAAYKKQFGITSSSWLFATAPRATIEKIAGQFGSLSDDKKSPLDHIARFYLVNTEGQLLLSYSAAPVDTARLTKDLTDAVSTFVTKPKT